MAHSRMVDHVSLVSEKCGALLLWEEESNTGNENNNSHAAICKMTITHLLLYQEVFTMIVLGRKNISS